MFVTLEEKQFYEHKNPDIRIAFALIKSHDLQERYQHVLLYCSDEDEQHFLEAFKATKAIDFGERVYFETCDDNVLEHLETLSRDKGGKFRSLERCSVIALDRGKALQLEINVPAEVHVKALDPEDADLVIENCATSEDFETFQKESTSFMSEGVYLKENNQLISWAVQTESGGIGYLHTLKHYRGRGYSQLAIRYLSIAMAQRGFTPFAYVEDPGESCFSPLGFGALLRVDWSVHLPGDSSSVENDSDAHYKKLPCIRHEECDE